MTDLTACQALLATLNKGRKVTLSQVREALGSDRSHWLDLELSRLTAERAEAQDARSSMSEYVKALQVADLINGRAERATSSASRASLYGKAATRYEEALTKLSELLQVDPALQRHLDRDMDWEKIGGGGTVQSDVASVPRIRYHTRRVFGETEHEAFRSRDEILIEALKKAIAEPDIAPSSDALSEDQNARLKALLKSARSA